MTTLCVKELCVKVLKELCVVCENVVCDCVCDRYCDNVVSENFELEKNIYNNIMIIN